MGFNGVKFWPLGYLFIYFFSKKILNKEFYKHQNLALILILIFCNIECITNSFIADEDLKCEKNDSNCQYINENSYEKIKNKLNLKFIPIIIILYLISMISNSYGMVKIKYLIDFKFMEIHKILMILGILGFFISMISVIVFNTISCGDNFNDVQDVCKAKTEDELYFDSLFYFESLTGSNVNIYLEILYVFTFQVVNSFQTLCNLLIIKKLDPFYLIPIDSIFFLIYCIIKFLLSIIYSKKLNSKYIFNFSSNSLAVICSLIYMEIIILNFNEYEKNIRDNISERERFDSIIANAEEDPKKIEIEIADNYTFEV